MSEFANIINDQKFLEELKPFAEKIQILVKSDFLTNGKELAELNIAFRPLRRVFEAKQ